MQNSPPTFTILLVIICVGHPYLKADQYRESVLPILKAHCFRCHSEDESNADIRFDTLSTDLITDAVAAETWQDTLDTLNRGAMPPSDEKQLSRVERQTLVRWITQEIDKAIAVKRSTGGQTVIRRLNRFEYRNTMRDLLGIDLDFAKNLPPDEMSPDGFFNNGQSLRMSAMQLAYYLQAARDAMQHALIDYPRPNVIETTATQSDEDKKGNWTNRLGRTGTFVVRSLEFPSEGEFRIRVRAKAEIPLDGPFPRLKVVLGYRADTQAPSREVATLEVASVESKVYEFRGRLEEFPLQTRTQSKFPGLLIWLSNAYSDGKPPPKPKSVVVEVPGKKKKKKTLVWEEDPDFPKIVIESVEFVAPVFAAWPPAHHTAILAETPVSEEDEIRLARRSIESFMRRAFRHPPRPESVEGALKVFRNVRKSSSSFIAAMRESLAMVLISPEFLYLAESTADASNRELDSYEIASRMSYFLWSSMPDSKLMSLADNGKLLDSQTRASECLRMLADDRSENFVRQFATGWLDLAGVDRVAVNPEFYPNFDAALKQDMREETIAFFNEVLAGDLSALNFLRSDFVVINRAMGKHYGMKVPGGGGFQRVNLPENSLRGGLLSQASILLSGSNGEDSHAILRGVWLRDRLLGDPPAPPPPNVPDLESDNEDFASLPLKEQLIHHRENEACANCHRGIDPWGLALEHFDAVGRYRDDVVRIAKKNRKHSIPVDAKTELPNGSVIDGADELKDHLLENETQRFARALTERLFGYGLGRSIELTDRPAIASLTRQFLGDDCKLKTHIVRIVASKAFATH